MCSRNKSEVFVRIVCGFYLKICVKLVLSDSYISNLPVSLQGRRTLVVSLIDAGSPSSLIGKAARKCTCGHDSGSSPG